MTDFEPDNNDDALNALAKKALKQVRALSRGNGAEPDSIQIKFFDGEMLQVEALNHLELHTEIAEEQKTGRFDIGELVEGPHIIQEAAQQIAIAGVKNQEIRNLLTKTILDRPDKGYAMHAEYFEIPQLNRTFSYHEPCGPCQGVGQIGCTRCGGRRQEVCSKCHGRAVIPCNFCGGSGSKQGADGKMMQCNRCFGKRHTACPLCAQTGSISCRQCNATGAIKCNACKGGAVNTRITNIIVKLKTLFEIDRTQLPDPATKIIQDQGPRMVEKGHIRLHAEPVRREDDGLAIQYQALFPYGDLELTINGKPLKTHVFGYKGKLLKLPNFIDQLIDGNHQLLQQAANAQGAVDGKIRKASHSRIIADGLVFSVTMPAKKAVVALKKKFPIGVSNEMLKDIIILSNKALANVTRKTRYGGLAIGIICAALIDISYFIGPLRTAAIAALGEQITIGADVLLVAIGGFIGATASTYMAQRPLQKVLGKLLPANAKGRLKPKTRNSVLPNYLASFVVFILVIYAAKMMGHSIPSWFPL